MSVSRVLSFNDFLIQLEQDGRFTAQTAEQLRSTPKGAKQAKQHPLETIADARIQDTKTNKNLDMDALLNWLSEWSKQDVFVIDPLKIDSLSFKVKYN